MEYRINEHGIIENCQLSENLSLYDLIKSDMEVYDIRLLSNFLSVDIVQNLELLAKNVLEPLIQQVGYVPTITRCLYLPSGRNGHQMPNDYAHMFGHAVDLMVPDDIVFVVKALENLEYDLMLYDFNALHIQYYDSGNRNTSFRVKNISLFEKILRPLTYLE